MRFSRTKRLIGEAAQEKLSKCNIAVFGVGGVGGYVAEALARSGVGKITLIDKDVVDESNINRQIIALTQTVGMPKVEVMKERILSINPEASVTAFQQFYLPENADFIDITAFDYVVDAIDNVSAKLELISRCVGAGVPVISAMGAGNKLRPELIRIDDIKNTDVCPLARVMRRESKKRGIDRFLVAYTTETPVKNDQDRSPASMMCVPAAMGIRIAAEIINTVIK